MRQNKARNKCNSWDENNLKQQTKIIQNTRKDQTIKWTGRRELRYFDKGMATTMNILIVIN